MENNSEKRLVSTWQMMHKNNSGEAEVTELHKYEYQNEELSKDKEFIRARPISIRPSRAQKPNRTFNRIIAFGDAQIGYREYGGEYHPIHDERAMKAARHIINHLAPNVIVNLGDTIDLPTFSRWDKDSNHFEHTLQAEFDRVHEYYGELRADNPHAEIHEVDSNHNVRLGRYVLKHMSQMYGVRQAGGESDYPLLTYPYMANLEKFDINWHGGYGAAKFPYAPDMIFEHGDKIRSNGSTAEMLSKQNPYNNLVVGHGHKAQSHTRTTPEGKYLTAFQVGALCKNTGEVPGFGSAVDDYGIPVHSQQDWQSSVLKIDDYGDGNYDFRNILIRGGKAYFDGVEVDGNI